MSTWSSQRGASPTARAIQVRGAFTVTPGDDWPPITLVDDVLTTGATLSSCARTLRRAGARSVAGVVAARVDAYSDFSVHQLPTRRYHLVTTTPATGNPMEVGIKGKNLPVTDALHEHAQRKLEKLTRFLPPWDEPPEVEGADCRWNAIRALD